MLNTYLRLSLSEQQKRYILLNLTKELIRNSGEDLYVLERLSRSKELSQVVPRKILNKKEADENREKIPASQDLIETPDNRRIEKGDIENVVGELKAEKYEVGLRPLPQPKERIKVPLKSAKITIPEIKLPPQFHYLQPTPTDKDIDLGSKLNVIVRDPAVKIIDCGGPEQNIVVTGAMGTKKTGVILNKDEVNEVVEKFSKASKIPVHEGVFRVVVGRLIFLAIVSEIVGSRFTIRKMVASVNMRKEI